jgi:hypothetical protein
MTEEHWFAWDDPRTFLQSLLYQLQSIPAALRSDRKLRLFAAACCRRVEGRLTAKRVLAAIDVAERYGDARTNEERSQIKPVRKRLRADPAWAASTVGRLGKAVVGKSGLAAAIGCSWYASYLVGGASARSEEERIAQGPLLRDIVGNPFRPVAFAPEWRTSTAVALARGMYESRDFTAMPILADALQDAGCDSDDILNHCRDAQAAHVRGCWVVDLVLDKK